MTPAERMVPGFFVQAVVEGLRDANVPLATTRLAGQASELLNTAWHGPAAPNHVAPAPGLPWAGFCELLSAASAASGTPNLGLVLGQQLTEANLDVFGPILVASRTLAEAVRHCSTVLASFGSKPQWHIEIRGAEALWRPIASCRHPVWDDLLVSCAFHLTHRFLGRTRATSVTALFPGARPSGISAYAACFGEQVRFNTGVLGVSYPRALLEVPRPGTDEALASMLCRIGTERFAGSPPASGWVCAVEDALRKQATLARVDVERLAAHWNLTARMLRRRIADEGESFSNILNRVRFERARLYLEHTGAPIAEIADMLGYGEMSSFQRAFKRWAGIGPRAYRAAWKAA